MARIPHLFYSSDSSVQTLHRRIVPSSDQQSLQQDRWNDLCEYLLASLGEKTGCKMSSWLQGSYKLKTQIRPALPLGEFDIDLGIYFTWDGEPDNGVFSPRDLKVLVQQALVEYAKESEPDEVLGVVVPPKTRCSRMRFSGDFHIDVPCYYMNPSEDLRVLATEEDKWEESDPVLFYEWFVSKFQEEDASEVRRLIRYFKFWSAFRCKSLMSSTSLTVLVAEAYMDLSPQEVSQGDDSALLSISLLILERLRQNPTIPNPVNPGENLNKLNSNDLDLFLRGIESFIAIGERALSASTEWESAIIWGENFGHFFPVVEQSLTTISGRALVRPRFIPEVGVIATPKNGSKGSGFSGRNRIGPIPRGCEINFRLYNASTLPSGSKVFWTVRNEGQEAENENDLGHRAGLDNFHAIEHSAYKGSHFMDVLVKSFAGEVLGFRRIPVEVSGIYLPPRNKKKPGYLKFRRKK